MDDRAANLRPTDPRRDEWTGLNFFLGEVDALRDRGLILDDAHRIIKGEYSDRRDRLESELRFEAAIRAALDRRITSPRDALGWANRARELRPDRKEGWVATVELLRKLRRFDESDRIAEEAAGKFPELARLVVKPSNAWKPAPESTGGRLAPLYETRAAAEAPPVPTISWASVAGEFLEEHWQKLISCLAVLLIVVSSTVGANLVLGPLLWSPLGKGILAMVYTGLCSAFGVGLVRWGAERAGRVMLATTLFLIPIDLMLAGELRLLADPSAFEVGLVAADAILLFLIARAVVSALGVPSGGAFTSAFFALSAFNAGASRGMPFEVGFPVFLAPAAVFLGAVAWLNARVRAPIGPDEGPTRLGFAYLEYGLLAFAFLSGAIRTGAVVLQLAPALYAVPAMLAAIAGVSTSRAVEPIEKDRQRVLMFRQGGLTLSALAFALAFARPYAPSSLFSGNTLGVAVLGLALYATSLRSTRHPAYLYCESAALFVAYFGAFYFAQDLIRSVEEAARLALGYEKRLPHPFKAINGLVFNSFLILLSRFFSRRWSDEQMARHCHYIGLPLSVAACVFSGFEPKAALICLGGYAGLYSLAAWLFAEPLLVYLACSAAAGSAAFGTMLAGGASLGLESLTASVLGLAFWAIRATPPLKEAGGRYRTPLMHSARVMAAASMAMAILASTQAGAISPQSTLAFLLTATLALLNGRESPRVSVYLLAIAALLGAWLGGYPILGAGLPATPMAYGLAVALFAVALLAVAEAARYRSGGSEPVHAFLGAIGWGVPPVVLASWSLATWGLVDSVTVARGFLVGSVALLWLTRFRRESVLVYGGLAGLTIWASCLCGLVVSWDRAGQASAWLAVTWSVGSLVIWGVGEWARRRDESFYHDPCFLTAGVLATGAAAWATGGWVISVDAYRIGSLAMAIGAVAHGLTASSRRRRASVALAAASAVGACDLALLSQGRALLEVAAWLGMASAAQAIACRAAGWWLRKSSGRADYPLARPLDFASLGLMVAAIPLGYQSPTTWLLVALASLPMLGCFPSPHWLYLTFFAVGAAIYRGWLLGFSNAGLIPVVMVGAYVSWVIAVALQRFGPAIRGRFGLADLRLDGPPVRVSVVLGILALAIRVRVMLDAGGAWSSLAWLPWAGAGLCLLMLRFEPDRGWVHAAVGLTGLGFAATLAPVVEPRSWWLSAGLALACAWALAGRGLDRFEGPFRRRLGIVDGRDSVVIGQWALAAFVLAGTWLVGLVLGGVFLPRDSAYSPAHAGGWSDSLLALGLAGLFVALEGRKAGPRGSWIGFEVVAVLAVWWACSPGSPFWVGWPGAEYQRLQVLPVATAACSLAVVLVGRWAELREVSGVVDPSEPVAKFRAVELREWTWAFGFILALASYYLSLYAENVSALLTLATATASLGLLAVGGGRVESAYAGGVAWCLAGAQGATMLAPTRNANSWTAGALAVSLGLTIALFGLWWLAGWVRRRSAGKGGDPAADERVGRAWERVAIGMTVPSVLLAMLGTPDAVWLGVGLVFASAVFYAMVAWRGGSEWPVYASQVLLLASYFRLRTAVESSEVVDAVVLSMLAYLDLGLSELLGRLRLAHYARPTFRFAMVLPLVPVARGAWLGHWDGVDLFVLLATGLFYALTGAKLRSKTPAYAAAVFFNAFLWLAWYQLGWSMADRPQFYLIPVGFSSILFAEVNRRELSRGVVNGARNLGLVLIYASLAAPIWQTQSFGAWLALLLLSLLGVFAGIGLRIQSFLWMGLACFVVDVAYQLARLGLEHALARWGVMLCLGVALILFVALNEKKRIVATMRKYYDEARTWE